MKHKVLTAKQMRALDRYTIKVLGVPEVALMENAGTEIFRFISENIPNFTKKKYIVLAGSGNNGGDAMVIARHLVNYGAVVTVVFCGSGKKMSRSARLQKKILTNMGVEISSTTEVDLKSLLQAADFCVDGMLGTGFSGKLRDEVQSVVNIVNSDPTPVLSIDVPSGLNADTGKPTPSAIRATWTITLGAYKKGLFLQAARPYVGKLRVVDIGLPMEQWLEQKK